MVEVVCESPPVATGQDMAEFGEKLVKRLLLEGPGATTPDELLAAKDRRRLTSRSPKCSTR